MAFRTRHPRRNHAGRLLWQEQAKLPEGSLDLHDVVRRGETSPEALLDKVRFVLGLMESRLRGLGVGWSQATTTNVYTVHDIYPWLSQEILRRMGQSQLHGVNWHFARPPIVSIEYEMDLRGCSKELIIETKSV